MTLKFTSRRLAEELSPDGFLAEWQSKENDLSVQIDSARKIVDKVTYTRRDLLYIASLTSSLNVDGHRADLVILKTARAQAAFDGRFSLSERDIALAAELALPHRLKRGPFQQEEMGMEQLQERIDELQGRTKIGTPTPSTPQPGEQEGGQPKK